MQNDNARERDIERRLGRVESPEPPADLLERIRGDIPEYLRPVGNTETASPGRTRRYRLAAASVLLAIAGGFLAHRVFREAPPPAATSEPGVVAVGLVGEETTVADLDSPQETPVTAQSAAPRLSAEKAEEASRTLDLAERLEVLPDRPLPADGEVPKPVSSAASEMEQLREADVYSPTGRKRPAARQEAMPEQYEEIVVEGSLPEPVVSLGASASVFSGTPADEAAATGGPSRQRSAVPEPKKARPAPELRRKRIAEPTTVAPPSTGGTAEPNDQPWGDMFFRPYGTNPFVDTEDDPRSTFGLDVDTGSYTLARGYLERGQLPPAEAIRVEEFLNYFDYRDPAPRRGDFTLTAEGAPSPWQRGPRYQLLRVGLRGREISAAQRRDATLIFVVDVSGSMARENRIQMVKRALHLLLDQLGSGDQVGLVVYGSSGRVLLEPSNDLAAVRLAIDRLSTGGSTNAEEGLLLGYQLARRYFRPESINRLVLCSDGVANVGRTGPESILERIGREAEEGIELTTVGFGMGNYNDVLMEQLADRGDGNYAYVDTLEEARRVFVENLTGTLETIAADAKVQVEFDPRVVSRYRLLGYENRDVADHRFRDDTVDAGEIGAGHRVTALYEIKLADGGPRRRALGKIRLRYRSVATGRVVEESLEVGRDRLVRSWNAASPSLRLAALAAELAEILKRSYWAREIRPEALRERARIVEAELGDDSSAAELVRLTERASRLVDWSAAPPE